MKDQGNWHPESHWGFAASVIGMIIFEAVIINWHCSYIDCWPDRAD